VRIQILDEAEEDLLRGFRFYEKQRSGLGDYFLDSLYSDIDSLHLFAGIHPWYFGCQRLLAKRFPFAIYYRIDKEIVRIRVFFDKVHTTKKTKAACRRRCQAVPL
jgi:hypothetical protein